jgi:hypothetical protein
VGIGRFCLRQYLQPAFLCLVGGRASGRIRWGKVSPFDGRRSEGYPSAISGREVAIQRKTNRKPVHSKAFLFFDRLCAKQPFLLTSRWDPFLAVSSRALVCTRLCCMIGVANLFSSGQEERVDLSFQIIFSHFISLSDFIGSPWFYHNVGKREMRILMVGLDAAGTCDCSH